MAAATVSGLLVLALLVSCCYCLDSVDLVEEGRAGNNTRRRRRGLRVWGVILMLILGKLAVTKLASALLAWGFIQKLCYLAGLFLSYMMTAKPPPAEPVKVDYNTLGYSYGPPEPGSPHGDAASAIALDYSTANFPYARSLKNG